MQNYQLNKRMPFMQFNWVEHGYRTSRLSLLERGVFDAIRTELWTVTPTVLAKEDLKLRLRIETGTEEEQILERLIALGLLREDSLGMVYDDVQVYEFGKAVEKGEKNSANAKKRWSSNKVTPEQTPGEIEDF